MPRWAVNASVVGGKHLGYVDADTEAEALEKAESEYGDHMVNLCHQCSGEIDDPQVDEISVYKAN